MRFARGAIVVTGAAKRIGLRIGTLTAAGGGRGMGGNGLPVRHYRPDRPFDSPPPMPLSS